MTRILRSHVSGRWVEGDDRQPLLDPTTEQVLAEAGTRGIDFRDALDHARHRGGPALRALSFAQRGELLQAMASAIHEHRDELIDLAIANGGNTRSDSKFDIDGCMGTLAFYANLGKAVGDAQYLLDGDPVRLSRSPRYVGRHVMLPLQGVAVHVNAFNFPAWGFGEKAAVALLAGMPVITKPATSTALVAERLVEILVERRMLPDGALSLICGPTGDLLDHLTGQDVLAFTGSAETGRRLRGRPEILARSVRVNVEADSLNSAVLCNDTDPGSPGWDLFVREVVKDITQKAGQKCTAIRRVFVPEDRLVDARDEIAEQLRAVKVGDPREAAVKMGPVATRAQLDDVRAGIDRLRAVATAVVGDGGRGELVGVPSGKGFFVAPVLMMASEPDGADVAHEREVFGPVATLMPYQDVDHVLHLVRRGDGSLVTSIYADDKDFVQAMIEGLASHHGRLNFGSSKVAEHSVGPGTVLPMLVHGGPGRAGGGEELGAWRGLDLYLQRTALQGDEPLLAKALSRAAPWPPSQSG
jgi:oxepin-CoA hydrolase/3-oxo-5,6-dehydrosuberyl-CoA semialdehyde dehydrogenase